MTADFNNHSARPVNGTSGEETVERVPIRTAAATTSKRTKGSVGDRRAPCWGASIVQQDADESQPCNRDQVAFVGQSRVDHKSCGTRTE